MFVGPDRIPEQYPPQALSTSGWHTANAMASCMKMILAFSDFLMSFMIFFISKFAVQK